MIRSISSDPSAVFPSGGSVGGEPYDVTVFNTGATTIYLGDLSVTPANGVPLRAGSNVVWGAGVPLYACTDPGKAGSLTYQEGAGSMFDAGGVANQLIEQGLPAQIAAKIAVSGAPPVDPLVTIETDSFNVAANAGHNSAWINVSGFQSISVRLAEVTPTVYGTPVCRRVTLWWSDASGGIPFSEESLFISDTNGNGFGSLVAFTTYQTSVKAAWVQIQWSPTSRAAELDSWVTGSYKTVARPNYLHQSAYSAAPAGWGEYGNGLDRLAAIYTSAAAFQNNVDYWWYPSVSAGTGYRSFVANPGSAPPAGGSLDAFIYAMADSAVALYGKRSYPGPFPFEDDNPLIIPFCPIGVRLRYNNAAAGTWAPTVSLALTYER